MDDKIEECDSFRAFDKITEPDIRGVGIFQTTDLKNWHKYIEERLKPSPCTPTEIRVQIETVKNLFLYSWFVYRFGLVAKNQMFNVTELALKKKFEMEGMPMPNGLRGKLEIALTEGWIDENSFPHISIQNGANPSLIIQGITSFRNELNHGSTMLYDPLGLIELSCNCMAIIEALFHDKST
ncbi:MAG: hypothetical protein JNL76_05470 [Alphaproteobacteria bacterium]|nr:hypothetical protein [Alphaproteobacteria bacterium]